MNIVALCFFVCASCIHALPGPVQQAHQHEKKAEEPVKEDWTNWTPDAECSEWRIGHPDGKYLALDHMASSGACYTACIKLNEQLNHVVAVVYGVGFGYKQDCSCYTTEEGFNEGTYYTKKFRTCSVQYTTPPPPTIEAMPTAQALRDNRVCPNWLIGHPDGKFIELAHMATADECYTACLNNKDQKTVSVVYGVGFGYSQDCYCYSNTEGFNEGTRAYTKKFRTCGVPLSGKRSFERALRNLWELGLATQE